MVKDIRIGYYNWLYFPFFFYRRLLFIAIPFIFTNSTIQIIAFVMANLLSIIIYGKTKPHYKSRVGIELFNDCFIMLFAYHLILFTDFVPSL